MAVSDEEIENLIRALIENGLDEENRKAALKWLNERVAAYMALQELRIV